MAHPTNDGAGAAEAVPAHTECRETAYWVFEVFATFGLFCFGFFGVFAFLSTGNSSGVNS